MSHQGANGCSRQWQCRYLSAVVKAGCGVMSNGNQESPA